MLGPALLLSLLPSPALAAPLALDPARPPERIGEARGLPVYRFSERASYPVLPAVVLSLDPGVAPPAGATSLGGPFWRLPAEDAVAESLRWVGRPGVHSAFPDVVLPTVRSEDASTEEVSFDDPSYGGQWYLESLGAPLLFARSLGDPDTRIAVIDSSIDIAHTDLAAAVLDPYDAHDDDDDPSPDPGEYCTDGSDDICDVHGTAVSGITAARANNGFGIVGLCPECTLVPIKMLGEPDRGLSVTIAAFEHAISADVAVINNSWGYVEPTNAPDALAEVIERARTVPRGGLGALVVFAAGNDDRELEDDELTSLPGVLCVSAMDSYGRWTNYTNYGAAVDISAPSATVSIAPEDEITTTFGGTSAAAPVASGVAAWVASQEPELTADEIGELLIASAVQSPLITPDEDGHHDYFGYGVLDAESLLAQMYGTGDTAADTGEGKEPRACGCAVDGGAGPAWLAGLAPLLLLRRRRR